MSSILPGPFTRLATTLVSGLVSTVAQTFAGAKTFAGAVVMSAGLAVTGAISATTTFRSGIGSASAVAFGSGGDDNTGIWFPAGDTINVVTGGNLRLQVSSTGAALFQGPVSIPTNTLFTLGGGFSTVYEISSGVLAWAGRFSHAGTFQIGSVLGAGATDVGTRLGFDTADGTVHTDAKLVSVGTGIGGTYVEKFWFKKTQFAVPDGSSAAPSLTFTADTDTGFWRQQANGMVCVAGNVRQWRTNGGTLMYLADDARWLALNVGQFGDAYGGQAGLQGSGQPAILKGGPTDGAAAVGAVIGSGVALANATAKSVSVLNASTEVAAFDKDGAVQLNIAGGSRPTPAAAHRGKLWYSKGAAGVADTIEICLKDAADAYAWVQIKP